MPDDPRPAADGRSDSPAMPAPAGPRDASCAAPEPVSEVALWLPPGVLRSLARFAHRRALVAITGLIADDDAALWLAVSRAFARQHPGLWADIDGSGPRDPRCRLDPGSRLR